ncbi:MAG: lysine--tRNA ligase [Alphaproteobacteria bacterium]
MTADHSLALSARAWQFEEARKIIARLGGHPPAKGYVLFETGYGPSGLPHIGTFGEVARTTMVRQAFQRMSNIPTKLIAFSDDMDGLRKVPSNLPNQDMLAQYLEVPVTKIPDPFGTHESFGHHNNARLCAFLDQFGFDYEFRSSTDCYFSGMFDATLLKVLQNFDAIQKIMLPSLRAERQATYSPFLPISPKTGKVLQVSVEEVKVESGTIVYRDPDTGQLTETPVTGGCCKLQWKPDWAMHWVAFDVDYEMSGKDLIDSVKLSSQICKVLGARPPEGFNYELFLDQDGEKISKSKGNGLSMEEWLRYAPPESLSYFMFQKPRTAKRLYFDVIPKAVDEYQDFLAKFSTEQPAEKLENPVWHIHDGNPPLETSRLSFTLLLNLVAAAATDDKAVLWGFISRYAPGVNAKTDPSLDRLVGYAIAYYHDFIAPTKSYRAPNEVERKAFLDLADRFRGLDKGADAETIQNEVYAVGKEHQFEPLREWFKALYEVLLGQSQGPRFGSFTALYGIPETIAMIDAALTRH